jgi:(E)-4-hydroxy-3-methylbut-2-enyl-diphosphate synthase
MNTYAQDLFNYKRYPTREVKVGNIGIGGSNPIRIQSMTTTDTMDTMATVEQSIRMIDAGCELVRITAPSMREARNLENIKNELVKRGYSTPLVADIHFTPRAAEIAAGLIEKVRVNPGNYADKKQFKTYDFTDQSYQEELDRIQERFSPLVKLCKQHGTAMRIGTNHGSLSDRILSRYGDTPLGMVESAMEFIRICESLDFHQIVLSMKASNPKVMVEAYRLLLVTMQQENMNYPLHLGVTEAGEGEDGRIKSAVGIGTLLEDGIGDTIRVSLTEEPEYEIPVARMLAERYTDRSPHEPIASVSPNPIDPFEFERQKTQAILNVGGSHVPRVIADFSRRPALAPDDLKAIGYAYRADLDKWTIGDAAADYLYIGKNNLDFKLPGTLQVISDFSPEYTPTTGNYPIVEMDQLDAYKHTEWPVFVKIRPEQISSDSLTTVSKFGQAILVLYTHHVHAMPHLRSGFMQLINHGITQPIVIQRTYAMEDFEQLQIYASTDFGGLLNDGLGQGIWITHHLSSVEQTNALGFGILQATRTRISKTEYISCPSCGRTLFDLQETTAKIRARTDHLKGLKIGIMGCIVNGPGEMADADYGYVGSGNGVITLYKEKEVVRKNIPTEQAVDELIYLIQENGDWVDPA